MDWDSVREQLNQHFTQCCDAGRLARFLVRLSETEAGHHLGACILMDVALKAVTCELFSLILTECDLDAVNIVSEFGIAVDRFEQKSGGATWAKRLDKDDDHFPREYARVMEMGTFVRHCLTPGKYDDMSPASLNRVRVTYFSNPSGRPLGRVTRTYSGGRGRVWVLPSEDLRELRTVYGERVGTEVRNALGLPITHGVGKDGAPEFVAVLYPAVSELPSAQPNTLDAAWTSPRCYFLPAKGTAGWGRTHNCAGTGRTCRERVHGALDGLSNAYTGIHIGVAATLDESNWRLILAEAYRRLETILNGSDPGAADERN